ncbi:MAG: efflux RND transporter permease subunit, partial [Planctomycetota bacterium]
MDAQQASGGPSPPAGNPLIALAARRPIALIMISTAIFVFGLISLARLPMDLMPEISRPTVTVRTRYPGAAPEDVEDRVSRRLEKTLSVVRGLRRITSISRAESSDVILEFAWSTEMKAVLQDVREKLDQTFLPDGAEASTILRYDPRLDPILQVGVVGGRDLKSLRLVAEEEVERRLETVPGIAAVRVRGGLEEEIRIEVDESRIRSRGISLAEISQRLAEENLDRVSGLLREGDISYVVRTRNEFRTVEEIGAIPIRRQGGSVIRLADVARLVPTHKEERVITRIDGRPAVKIEILREARANIVELAARVKRRIFGSEGDRRRLAEWRAEQRRAVEETPPTGAEPGDAPVEAATIDGGDREGAEKAAGEEDGEDDGEEGATEEEDAPPPPAVARPDIIVAYLPEGVELTLLSDQSVFIESAIHDLEQTAMLGGLLAVAVLFLFLGRFS